MIRGPKGELTHRIPRVVQTSLLDELVLLVRAEAGAGDDGIGL